MIDGSRGAGAWTLSGAAGEVARCATSLVALGLSLVLAFAWGAQHRAPSADGFATVAVPAPAVVPAATRAKATRDYGALPLAFVANAGQSDARARYLAQGGGYGFFFTERGVTLTLSTPVGNGPETGLGWLVGSRLARAPFARAGADGRAVALELGFVGASAPARIVASKRATGTVSYLGSGRAAAQAGLATYREPRTETCGPASMCRSAARAAA